MIVTYKDENGEITGGLFKDSTLQLTHILQSGVWFMDSLVSRVQHPREDPSSHYKRASRDLTSHTCSLSSVPVLALEERNHKGIVE